MEIILKNRLNAEDVRELSEKLLKKHLTLEVEGHKVTTGMVLNVLMKATIEKRSIEAVCADLSEVVDSNTLREVLNREWAVPRFWTKVYAWKKFKVKPSCLQTVHCQVEHPEFVLGVRFRLFSDITPMRW